MTEGPVLLERSQALTRTMDECRGAWAKGKGKDFGTAQAYMAANGKRRGVVQQLRGMFRLVVDNT